MLVGGFERAVPAGTLDAGSQVPKLEKRRDVHVHTTWHTVFE